jgi:hypothetical protein
VSQELGEFPLQMDPINHFTRNYLGTMMDDTVTILTAKALVPNSTIIPQ